MSDFSSKQKKIFQEAFDLFDQNLDGVVEFDQIGSLLRSVGQSPTDLEIKNLISELEKDQEKIDFKKFLELIKRFDITKEEKEEELIKAFEALDRKREGFIFASELRYILTKFGEPLTKEDVTDILRGVGMDKDGKVNYKDFINFLIQK
ncbi:ef-hand protein [Anaeramoeba ignava]|uniref:Ef-hand protein n=1 Tax=Anaeramoeba ignava TaxID=1746090 RepID=A0A9Q0R7M5_ANAIG|nr:ef-hand protein [Anaeramoeba ignava]